MNLYSWVRGGASIYLGRIGRISVSPQGGGMETVTIYATVEETLWGKVAEHLGPYKIVRPVSVVAQLREPDPIWGGVKLSEGRYILVVADATTGPPHLLAVDEVEGPQDGGIQSIRAVLDAERKGEDEHHRLSRYMEWVEGGTPAAVLFAAEALSKDGLPELDDKGKVAIAFAHTFDTNKITYIRINLATLMWQYIYPRSSTNGQIAIISATIRGAEGTDEDVQRFALDRLGEADPKMLQRAVVDRRPSRAVQLLRYRLDKETDVTVRERLSQVISALQ